MSKPRRQSLELRENDLQDTVDVLEDFVVPESENRHAFSFEKGCSLAVLRDLVGMLAAVQFNNQTALTAQEIANEWPARDLAAEFEAAELPTAQMSP